MNKGKDLRQKLKRGDMSAFADIYDVYSKRIYHYLLGILRSEKDAEDVIQNTFLRLLSKRKLLRWAKNLEGYIFRIVRNEAMRFIKRQRKNREIVLEEMPEILICEKPDARNEIREEEKGFLNKAIGRLPLEQREVIILKSFEDKSFKEIGRILRISQNTAASRFRYAIEKLKDYMGELGR